MNASRTTFVLCVLVCHAASLAAPPPVAPRLPITPTQDLLADTPGLKAFIQGQNIVALYGVAIDSDPTLSARGLADRFLFGDVGYPAQANALGVEDVDLVYKNEVTAGDDRFTVVTYTQEIDGLPVHGTSVKIQVMLKDHPDGLLNDNTISYIGMRLVYLPQDPLPEGTFTDQAARDKVTAQYGFTSFSPIPADEVIYQADDDSMHRAWRFSARDDDEAFLFFVDTTSEKIVGVVNLLVNAEVTGKVRGYATQGPKPLSATTPVIRDLPGVEVFLYPGDACPATPWTDPAIEYSGDEESNLGAYGPLQYTPPAWLGARLVGEWVTVDDLRGTWSISHGPTTVCAERWVACPGGHDDCPDAHTCDILNSCEGGFCSNDPRLGCSIDSECYFCNDTRDTACPYENECAVDELCITAPTCGVDNKCSQNSLLSCTTDNDCWYCSTNLIFNESQTEYDTAAVNAFAVVEETHDWFAELLGDSSPIDQKVTIKVNAAAPCQAYYEGGSNPPRILCSTAGIYNSNFCENSAMASIISHEYAHFVLDQYASTVTFNPFTESFDFGEGFADTFSSLMWNTECMSDSWVDDGFCVRNLDAVVPERPSNHFAWDYVKCFILLPGLPCTNEYACDDPLEERGCEVQLGDERCSGLDHCEGMALAGAFWDLRRLLLDPQAEEPDWITERLFANFTVLTRAELDEQVLVEVLTADDNDGNLGNGTPHGQDILCAFVGASRMASDDVCGNLPTAYTNGFQCNEIGHGWPCPPIGQGDDGRVKVDWFGPIGAYEHPVGDVDYTINYDLNPPVVTLITTEKGDPGDVRAVQRWFVGCKDSAGNTCDLGGVYAEWEAAVPDWPGVVVKVGTTPTEPCNDLHVIDIPRYADAKYSDIELKLAPKNTAWYGSLLGRARCEASTGGAGGRIGGTVAEWAKRIKANDVGSSDPQGVTSLTVDDQLWKARFDTIGEGKKVQAREIWRFLEIAGELNGAIQVGGSLSRGAIRILGTTGESTGNISIAGDIDYGHTDDQVYAVYIAGNMSGDIDVAGNVGMLDGAIAGHTPGIRIDGNMSGNIHVNGSILENVLEDGFVEIGGVFDGDICAANVRPDLPLPGNIDIFAFGSNATVCGWRIDCKVDADCDDINVCTNDTCDGLFCSYTDSRACTPAGTNSVAPPTPAKYPYSAPKNRYISFNPINPPDQNIAFRVELKSITLGSCNGTSGAEVDFCREGGPSECKSCSTNGNSCQTAPIDCAPIPPQTCDPTGETCVNDAPHSGGLNVGKVWWVGPEKNKGVVAPNVHLLVSEPFRKVSDSWPSPTHVADCEIVPQATYGVKAVEVVGGAESSELDIETTAGSSTFYYGDCVGRQITPGVWSPPDGTVNVDDMSAALWLVAPFPGLHPGDLTWIDIHGNDSGEPASHAFDPPNYVANHSDLQQIRFGFEGYPYRFYDPADCPDTAEWPDPNDLTGPPSGSPSFVLVPNDDLLDPVQDLQIDVYISEATNVFGYEFALEVTGGSTGSLALIDVTVDAQRTDYLFNGITGLYKGKDLARQRYGAILDAPGAGITKTGQTYLATFTYQPVGGASGVFTISVKGALDSFLLKPDGSTQRTETDACAVVGYGIDCLNDGHCDDINDCTDDSCVFNACEYANVALGTGCDDGLWCTVRGSTCDGNGNCTGGTPRCQPGEICDEQAQLCIGEAP